jgi:hypothetical protein
MKEQEVMKEQETIESTDALLKACGEALDELISPAPIGIIPEFETIESPVFSLEDLRINIQDLSWYGGSVTALTTAENKLPNFREIQRRDIAAELDPRVLSSLQLFGVKRLIDSKLIEGSEILKWKEYSSQFKSWLAGAATQLPGELEVVTEMSEQADWYKNSAGYLLEPQESDNDLIFVRPLTQRDSWRRPYAYCDFSDQAQNYTVPLYWKLAIKIALRLGYEPEVAPLSQEVEDFWMSGVRKQEHICCILSGSDFPVELLLDRGWIEGDQLRLRQFRIKDMTADSQAALLWFQEPRRLNLWSKFANKVSGFFRK